MPNLFTPEDRKQQIVALEIPLEKIAALYRGNVPPDGCECIDIECERPWCPLWWQAFFVEFDQQQLVEMVNLYLFDAPEEEG